MLKPQMSMLSGNEIAPWYQDDFVSLYCGDCRTVLPQLSFDADELVTDPPYGQNWQSGKRTVSLAKLEGDQDTRMAVEGVAAALKHLKRGRHAYIFGRYEFEGSTLCEAAELIWDKELFNGGNLEIPWGNAHEYIQFAVHETSKANRAKGYGRLAARLRRGTVITGQRNTRPARQSRIRRSNRHERRAVHRKDDARSAAQDPQVERESTIMTRKAAKAEAVRLTKLVGRDIDLRTIDCPCDYSRFCDDCGGSGSFFEFFFTFCDHKVEEDDRDSDCYDNFCSEREKARRDLEAA